MQIESTRIHFLATTRRSQRAFADRLWLAIAAWVLLIAGVFVWGSRINRAAAQDLDAPPLFGHFSLHLSPSIVLVAGITGVLVVWGRALASSLSWRKLLGLAWAGSVAWTVALNIGSGLHQLAAPLATGFEYRAAVASVSDPARFLATFVSRLSSYPVHVEGHPPGMVLLLWGMERIGLGAVGWEAALVIAAGTSAVVATLIVCRSLAGEGAARRCAPFLVLAPMALWVATSADALFLGVSAWALALLLPTLNRGGKHALRTWAGGLTFGAALLLSYGSLALLLLPLAVGLRRRAFAQLGAMFLGILCLLALFWATGFSWVAGLQATKTLYLSGVAHQRGYLFFLFADLAAFAIVVGPAAAAALTTTRRDPLRLLVGITVIALLVADVSGYSKGEVERIWLPFAPWVLIATADLPDSLGPVMLGLQGALAVAVAIGVRTPW